MINFPFINIEGSPGKEFCQEYKLDSGSVIYKKTTIKGSSTAWHDGRYYDVIYQLFLNKEEYDKIRDGFGVGQWTRGLHFYGGNYIYCNNFEVFKKAIEYLGL